MNDSYTNMLAKLKIGSAHPGGLALTKKIIDKVKNYPHQTILDAGCGTGCTLAYLAEQTDSTLIGIDQHSQMIDHATKRLAGIEHAEVILADMSAIPIEANYVNCVIAESSVSFTKILNTLREFNRILQNNGIICLVEMTAIKPLTDQEEEAFCSFYGFDSILTKNDWIEAIEKAEFTVLESDRVEPETKGPIDLEIEPGIDPSYFKMMAEHYHLIEQLKDKLGTHIYIAQKRNNKVETNGHR
ncbi:class I SAM-dependent methyltransferase [Amphibacillus cookii]|uniref:class I SAM-dependent methyltransferase n=1 Tax=Amphibacillus cookii TaxID=767787 RepID=UPI00195AA26C|nr:class I SAM-dependent methyltransferase [Amphibacillus cookii]MBM7540972.1 ubiquinone/menaquinone biosynthesis C-methylase UbiE [Amphibacillus cookii]